MSTPLVPTVVSARRASPWASEDNVKVKLLLPVHLAAGLLFLEWMMDQSMFASPVLPQWMPVLSSICEKDKLSWAAKGDFSQCPLQGQSLQSIWTSPVLTSHPGRRCLRIFVPA